MQIDRETIIKLARVAGFELSSLGMTYTSGSLPELLERFAKLVAEHVIKDAPDYKMGYADGVVVEREACAKVCDEWVFPVEIQGAHPDYLEGKRMAMSQCAAAIRARGQ